MKKKRILFGTFLALGLWLIPEIDAANPPLGPSDYKPDYSKSDIYIPHLKRTPLSGWWKLHRGPVLRTDDRSDSGVEKKFHAEHFDDSAWQDELVPGRLNCPFSLNYDSTSWASAIGSIPQTIRSWGGTAWFRRTFELKDLKKNERVVLHFEDLRGSIDLYVNGHEICRDLQCFTSNSEYHGPEHPQDFDLTGFVKRGKNVIALRVFHNGEPFYFGWSSPAGILDMPYVDVRPGSYADPILVTPSNDRRTVTFDCLVKGGEKKEDLQGWNGDIFEWKSGKKVAAVRFGAIRSVDGQRMISGRGAIPDAKTWSPEHPFLYGIKIRNASGEVVGCQRFGMRTIEISGHSILLNGKPTFLHGICGQGIYPVWGHGWWYAYTVNAGDAFRKMLEYFTSCHVNHWRLHSSFPSRTQADLYDEAGILLTPELGYDQIAIKNPTREDFIAMKHYDSVCDAKGNLHPAYRKKLRDRIQRFHSNPSVATFSFGNEICRGYDDPRINNMLNQTYDLFKKYDRQQRPCTNSSGRAAPEAVELKNIHAREKLDYLDMHNYSGSLRATPLYAEDAVFDFYLKTAKELYKDKLPPILNGETVYYSDHFFAPYKKFWNKENDAEPNWPGALFILNGDLLKKDAGNVYLAGYWLRNDGSRNYVYHRAETRAAANERILEQQRRHWPWQAGYEALTSPIEFKLAWPFEKISFERLPIWYAMKRVNAPVIAVFDMLFPSRYAGEQHDARVHLINNSESDASNVHFSIRFKSPEGKILKESRHSIGVLKQSEKKTLPLTLAFPDVEGPVRMVYELTSGETVLNTRFFNFNLRKRAPLSVPLKTAKKIVVYDAAAAYGDLKDYGTVRAMRNLNVPFEQTSDFKKLDGCDLLVIGTESIDGTLIENAPAIRAYVENGGRLLVFDQNYIGRVPFLSELEYSAAGAVEFSEILRRKHPAVNALAQEELRCWNPCDGSVYHSFLTPVSEACITMGGNTATWGSTSFGMVSAHVRVGKGDMLFCQLETTANMNRNPGAARLFRNLLDCMLDDASRAQARPFIGYKPLKIRPVPEHSARTVSLRSAANMDYADQYPNDGKGGWHDQGSSLDLRCFPSGRHFFGGIPFETIDPASNGGRSMVVAANIASCRIPVRESREIPLGFKLKRLFFLHTGAWVMDDSAVLAEYVITARSGKQYTIPLRKGKNIGDWFNPLNQNISDVDCVWTGSINGGIAGAWLMEWKNPNPDDPVVSVRAKANRMVLGLLGLTAEIRK